MPHPTPLNPARLWQIRGSYYDLEPFLDKHPGGRRFLEQCRGTDCTALFESTHLHDKLPRGLLPTFHVGDVPDYQPAFDWDGDGFYPTLKRRVAAHFLALAARQGLSRVQQRRAHHGTRPFILRFGVFWLLYLAASIGAVGFGLWWCALAWSVLAFALGGYGHEAMHAGVFASPRANRILAWLTLDLNGLSSFVFTATHVPLHHIYTNVIGLDPDIEVHYPLIRERTTQPLLWFHRHQHVFAWVIYFITLPVLFVADLIGASTGVWLGPWGKMQKPYASELFAFVVLKLAALGIWYVLPWMLHPWSTALLMQVLMIGGAGLIVQTTFALSHQNHAAMNTFDRIAPHPRDWGAQQLFTTVDFQDGHWLPVTLAGGLGYQIEHHLFPTLSYSRLREVAPIVRETCQEFGVPYFYYPTYASALRAHYRFLRDLGRATQGDEATAHEGMRAPGRTTADRADAVVPAE